MFSSRRKGQVSRQRHPLADTPFGEKSTELALRTVVAKDEVLSNLFGSFRTKIPFPLLAAQIREIRI